MFRARTRIDVHNRRIAIERISRLSDNLIGIGPFRVGLDGLLAWVPGVGEIYSLGAGAALVAQGYRARVPAGVLAQAAVLVSVRTLANILPIFGGAIVGVFRGHRMAAKVLQRAIDETLYIEGEHSFEHPLYAQTLAQIGSGEERRRVVFLGMRPALPPA